MPGQAKPKLSASVSQAITSAAKIHAGQLIETAKLVQIQEIKEKLALKYPHQGLMSKSDESEENR